MTNSNENIEILMNKISELEKELDNERKTNTEIINELKELKTIKLPLLEKTLEEKENFIEKIMIEQIDTNKELMKYNNNSIKSNNIPQCIYKDLQTDKDNIIQTQNNKIETLNKMNKELLIKNKNISY